MNISFPAPSPQGRTLRTSVFTPFGPAATGGEKSRGGEWRGGETSFYVGFSLTEVCQKSVESQTRESMI